MEEQENRHHKKNEKLDKKRKKEKELKKIKKVQKKANELLRDEKRDKFFAQKNNKDKNKIKRDKAIKAFKSFIKIYQDDLEDFFELFQQLDEGNVVETGEIENKQIKEKLDKLMKKLKLRNKGSESAPIFKKVTDTKLEHYVRGLYDEVVKGIQYQESESSDSEISRSQSESSKEAVQQIQKNKIADPVQNEQKNKVKQLSQEIYEDKKFDRNQVRASLYADQELKQKKPEEFSELDQFLEQSFSKVGERKLTNYLNERKKTQTQPVQQPKNENIFLGDNTEKKLDPEQVKEFMQWYDQTYRSKSLAEEHREKLQREKMEKNKSMPEQLKQQNVRKEFNRDTDMNISSQNSSEFLAQIRQSGSLNSKFSSGHFKNQFI